MPGELIDWKQWLRDLFCKLYQELGGDCDNLGQPTHAIEALWEIYLNNGVPSFPTPEDKKWFRNLVLALEAHLNLKENDLDSKDDESIRELIARLLKDTE